MENRKYKVVIAQSGKLDVKEKKKYILSSLSTGSMQRIFPKRLKKRFLHLIHFRPDIIQQVSGIVAMIFT